MRVILNATTSATNAAIAAGKRNINAERADRSDLANLVIAMITTNAAMVKMSALFDNRPFVAT